VGKFVNKIELAEITGKSERTLTAWQKSGMPIELNSGRGSSNQYDTASVIEWMINREMENRIKKHGGDRADWYDYEKERARLTHHQANKVSLEEKVLHGELIPISEVLRVQGNMVSAFRARALAIPTKAAHDLLGVTELNQAKATIKEFIFEALDELSDFDPVQYDLSPTKTDNGVS
jgi:phage terminase Nu1 subunit (DNA packaging protein)